MLVYRLNEINDFKKINSQVKAYEVNEAFPDVISIENILVNGHIKRSDFDYLLDVNIKADLVMACAFTLKPVDVLLDFDLSFRFGSSEKSDYELTDPLDLNPIILGNILAEKPYNVFHESADPNMFCDEPRIHPAFEGLKDLIKTKDKEGKWNGCSI